MSINDLTPDSCNDVHILTDLSRHFAFDSTLREDILPNPLFLDSDLPDSIPHSFNLHALYSNYSTNSPDIFYSKGLAFIDPTPSIQCNSQFNSFCLRSMISDSASSIVKSSVSSANILAHDIISSAPHFPPSETLYNICRSNHSLNNDVDSQLDLLSEGIMWCWGRFTQCWKSLSRTRLSDLSTAVEHNISQSSEETIMYNWENFKNLILWFLDCDHGKFPIFDGVGSIKARPLE